MSQDLIEFLSMMGEQQAGEIRVAVFAKVIRFVPASTSDHGPFVDVQPQVKEPLATRDEERSFESLPVLPGVPVMFPQAGAFSITWPLTPGDTVLLVIPSREWSHWFATGNESPSHDDRTHSPGNAVAIPCGFWRGHGAPSNPNGLSINAGRVNLGSINASMRVALLELLQPWLDTFRDTFLTHTHASGAMGTPTGTPLPPATLLPVVPEFGSNKVRSDP